MPDPVFVIHGVNVRDQAAFEEDVRTLNRKVGDEWEFVPVFWADIAAKVDFLTVVIPHIGLSVRSEADDDTEFATLASSLLTGNMPGGAEEVRSPAHAAEIVADAAVSETQVRAAADGGEIRREIEIEWENQRWLPLVQDEQTLKEIGRAIVNGVLEEQEVLAEVRGGEHVKRAVRRVMGAIDKAMSAVISLSAGNLHQYLRRSLSPHIGRFLGDIFVYESQRDAIQRRLRDAVAARGEGWGTEARAVNVLAHSLGGLVTFDSAVRPDDPLHVRSLVTFGSQPAFFHVVNRRYELTPFAGTKIRLGRTVRRWLNVWQPLDPLAFIAGAVFEIDEGIFPKDIMLPHRGSDPLWTHSVYWSSDVFASEVREFLLGSP